MASARIAGRLVSRAVAALTWGIVAASLAIAPAARADEPVKPEADANPSTMPPPSARPNLMLVGAAVAVGWYGAALGSSYIWNDAESSPPLRIPVAGPYMSLAKTGCSSAELNCDTFTVVFRTIITSLSLVGQTGGLLAMLEGAFVPTATPKAESRFLPKQTRQTHHVAIVPTPATAGGGLAIIGDF
jgi:hypothetical protein